MNKSHVICAFIGGALIGGAIALLFAPKSGKELRKDVAALIRKKCKCAKQSEIDEIVDQLTAEVETF